MLLKWSVSLFLLSSFYKYMMDRWIGGFSYTSCPAPTGDISTKFNEIHQALWKGLLVSLIVLPDSNWPQHKDLNMFLSCTQKIFGRAGQCGTKGVL